MSTRAAGPLPCFETCQTFRGCAANITEANQDWRSTGLAKEKKHSGPQSGTSLAFSLQKWRFQTAQSVKT